MRDHRFIVGALLGILLMLISLPLPAQTSTLYAGVPATSLATAATTGPGTAYKVTPSVSSYTWTVVTGGTVTTATINLEGSIDSTDGTNGKWFVLDQATQADLQWSSGEMRHVVNKGVNFVRCNLAVITGGGSITAKLELIQ